ncbi:DMT family transporter [Pseudoalteromonas xiamenensis]|uniref:DMT family transporter n=1 Tax=Pseudoalteromonas xiamenensis TaxID=882626 RepID=UPI0035E6C811
MPAGLCLLIATMLWGSSFVALKFAIDLYDPHVVIFFRMLTTLILCLALFRYTKRFTYQQGDLKYLLAMSLAEPCLYFLFEGHAIEYTSASQAGVIVACLPLIVALLAYFLLKERLSKSIVSGFTLCIGGSIALTFLSPSSEQAPNPLLGNTLEFLAMICAAFYTISVKRLATRYSPLALIGVQGLSGSVFFACFLPFSDFPDFSVLNQDAVLSILYLGSVVTLGAYGLYNYAISRVSVLTAAAYSNLVPVFTLLFSAVLLAERLNLWQWAAIALVFAGVAISQRHKEVHLLEDTPADSELTATQP